MDATAPHNGGFTVKALADRVNVHPDTVRYYERVGLLAPPRRSSAGYRHYPSAAVDRLRFVQGAKRLGLRLAEIRELLAVCDTGQCPCEPAETMLARRLNDVEAEMSRLSALRADLERALAAMPGTGHSGAVPAPQQVPRKEVTPVTTTETYTDSCCVCCPPGAVCDDSC